MLVRTRECLELAMDIVKSNLFKVLFAAIILTFSIHGFTLFEKYLITDDIAQHHIWLDAGTGNGLESNDPWIIASKAIQPYFLSFIDRVAHLCVPTLLVGKCIALLSFALTCVLVFALGKEFANNSVGWVALSLFCISDAWIGMSGGFARAFAWPLVALFLYGSARQNNSLIGLSLFASAALYPIVFVLVLPAWLMILFYDAFFGRDHTETLVRSWNLFHQQRLQLLAIVSGALLVLLKSHELSTHYMIGSQVSLAELQTSPLYGPEGRWPLWPQSNLLPSLTWSLMPWGKSFFEPLARHINTNSYLVLFETIFSFISIVAPLFSLYLVKKTRSRNAFILLSFASSGVVTFLLAKIFLPKLYEPSRYLVWSMPLLAILCWSLLFNHLLSKIKNDKFNKIAVGVFCLLVLTRYAAIRGKGAEDVSEYSFLYQRLSQTKKQDIIASIPRTSDFIPVFANRSIFVSHESSHAVLFSNYRNLVVSRQDLFVEAFYSMKSAAIEEMVSDHGVDWFIVEEKYYTGNLPADFHFAPYKNKIIDSLKLFPEPFLLKFARIYGETLQEGTYLIDAKTLEAHKYSLE